MDRLHNHCNRISDCGQIRSQNHHATNPFLRHSVLDTWNRSHPHLDPLAILHSWHHTTIQRNTPASTGRVHGAGEIPWKRRQKHRQFGHIWPQQTKRQLGHSPAQEVVNSSHEPLLAAYSHWTRLCVNVLFVTPAQSPPPLTGVCWSASRWAEVNISLSCLGESSCI